MFIGKKHLVSQSEKPEKDSSHLDINTNIYKSLVLIYDNENKELGFGVTTFKSTVRVHIDVVKNCNGNPTVKFLCNNAKVTTIHYTQTGDIVILTVSNSKEKLNYTSKLAKLIVFGQFHAVSYKNTLLEISTIISRNT